MCKEKGGCCQGEKGENISILEVKDFPSREDNYNIEAKDGKGDGFVKKDGGDEGIVLEKGSSSRKRQPIESLSVKLIAKGVFVEEHEISGVCVVETDVEEGGCVNKETSGSCEGWIAERVCDERISSFIQSQILGSV
ncbi:unnamed protein product [Ilex paraguariensis]|uniref:Uncharacterized protein n=1 Tax=Ilex paraguariensis TaxID=185542 RepID=A0ABC8SG82_9AQUA